MANELYTHTLRQLRDGCMAENMDTEAEALEAAIQALSCEGDCVSRQAVIDAVKGWVNKALDDWGYAETEIRCFNAIYPLIMALPSAQPNLQPTCNRLHKQTAGD